MSIFQKSKYRFVELFKKRDIIVSISRRISSLSKEAIWVQDLSGMFPSTGDQIIAKLCFALGYGDIFYYKGILDFDFFCNRELKGNGITQQSINRIHKSRLHC